MKTGITFTFGGPKITYGAEVEDTTGRPIPGLYAAGEIDSGLYYHRYASGTGLMSGAVFGRPDRRPGKTLRMIAKVQRFNPPRVAALREQPPPDRLG